MAGLAVVAAAASCLGLLPILFLPVGSTAVGEAGLALKTDDDGCTRYTLAHSGCIPQHGACIENVTQIFHADGHGPPFGMRFMYATGGREISSSLFTTVARCALLCVGEDGCKGFVNVGNESCITVNDTTHAVGTALVADSYELTKKPNCSVDCGDATDGMVFALPSNSQRRPVASDGGREQCQQYCDVDPTCGGVVVSDGECRLADVHGVKSPPVNTLLNVASWLKHPSSNRATTLSGDSSTERPLNWWWWWIADSATHVFPSAEPFQTAYCSAATGGTPQEIDWAAAPGTYVASQLVVKTDGGTPVSTVRVVATALVSSGGEVISGSMVELSQVGLIEVNGTGLNYVNEVGSGLYPDVLQPLPGPDSPSYQLAAVGKQEGANGFRFGSLPLLNLSATSVASCQAKCNDQIDCEGIFFAGGLKAGAAPRDCILVNSTRLVIETDLSGLSYRRQHQGLGVPGHYARSIWVALSLDAGVKPGRYRGSLNVSITSSQVASETASVPIALEVWPIGHGCIQRQLQDFGLAFGFDHHAVANMYPAANTSAKMKQYAVFSEERHIPTNSLTGWNSWSSPVMSASSRMSSADSLTPLSKTEVPLPNSLSCEENIRRLLRSQHLFPAYELGITPHRPEPSVINSTWVEARLTEIAPRLQQLTQWGLLNSSYVCK
jgi:hypothetical protein